MVAYLTFQDFLCRMKKVMQIIHKISGNTFQSSEKHKVTNAFY